MSVPTYGEMEAESGNSDLRSKSDLSDGLSAAISLFEREREECKQQAADATDYSVKMAYTRECQRCVWAIERLKMAQGR